MKDMLSNCLILKEKKRPNFLLLTLMSMWTILIYMKKKTYYPIGAEHPNWKEDRNKELIMDRYPNWPATGTTRLQIKEIQAKYSNEEGKPMSRSRVFAIIKRMKELKFFK